MKLTRRALLAGVAAIPAVAGVDRLAAAATSGGGVVLYDPGLPHARERALASAGWADELVEITGDRVRFARQILARRPLVVRGISRQADALLIEEVAAEAGYRREAIEVNGAILGWVLSRRV